MEFGDPASMSSETPQNPEAASQGQSSSASTSKGGRRAVWNADTVTAIFATFNADEARIRKFVQPTNNKEKTGAPFAYTEVEVVLRAA